MKKTSRICAWMHAYGRDKTYAARKCAYYDQIALFANTQRHFHGEHRLLNLETPHRTAFEYHCAIDLIKLMHPWIN